MLFKNSNVIFFGEVGFVGILNTGAAFGFLAGNNLLFIIITLILLIVLSYLFFKLKESRLGLLFVIAGAFGNLIDRIFFKGVIDFIHLGFWPTFNLADVFIVVGVIFLLWKSFRQKSI